MKEPPMHATRISLSLAAVACLLGAAIPAAGLEIEVPQDATRLRAAAGVDAASERCSTCHSADYVAIQPPGRPLAFWKAEVEKMKKVYGAPIPDAEIEPIAQYLTRAYGDGK
jgi:sulfite dehydrogenase (cytochrome) subunit B